jgi:lipoic acid synthetase
LTVGQYLAPTPKHIPIERYYTPDEFAYLRAEARAVGFRYVEAGPLVRSSYHAGRHAQDGADSADYGADSVFHEREAEGLFMPPLPLVQLTRA